MVALLHLLILFQAILILAYLECSQITLLLQRVVHEGLTLVVQVFFLMQMCIQALQECSEIMRELGQELQVYKIKDSIF